MAELDDINQSGELSEINLQGTNVLDLLLAAVQNGVKIHPIPAADAEESSIFYNSDINRLCYKGPGGWVRKFSLVSI